MKSVFRIHPYELKKKLLYINYIKNENLKNSYDFLDIINKNYNIDVSVYYCIIDNTEEFKLKNIFYFMNSRLQNINKKIIYDKRLFHNTVNKTLKEFINDNIVNGIIIMNLLTHYIYP